MSTPNQQAALALIERWLGEMETVSRIDAAQRRDWLFGAAAALQHADLLSWDERDALDQRADEALKRAIERTEP